MNPVDLLVGSLVGGVVGLILAVLFQSQLEHIKEAAWHRLCRVFRTPSSPRPPETFVLGQRSHSFLVIDGDGESVYRPQTITAVVEEGKLELPSEIHEHIDAIADREAKKKAAGLPACWNGPTFALQRYAIGRTVPDENLELTLTLRPSDYFTFQASVMSLDVPLAGDSAAMTLRQRYLQGADLSKPIPFLAQGFGIAIIVFSADCRELILSRRSDDAGTRPGELDVTFVETVHPNFDRNASGPGMDLYRTAIRGASEEVGLDLYVDEINFLGFGVDTQYYQWNLLGMARLRTSVDEAFTRRCRGTAGKWETRTFEVHCAEPKKLLSELRDQTLWATAWVLIYWALVRTHGRPAVDRAVREVFGD